MEQYLVEANRLETEGTRAPTDNPKKEKETRIQPRHAVMERTVRAKINTSDARTTAWIGHARNPRNSLS